MRSPRSRRSLVLVVAPTLVAALGALLVAPGPGSAAEGDVIALVGGEVRTVSGDVLRNATVLVRDGRIQAVGAGLAVPAGARTIDCSGRIVTPGLVDADCYLGVGAADASGAVPGADTPLVSAFDPWDARLRSARAQGVTTLHLAGNRAQLLGGVAAVVSTGEPGTGAGTGADEPLDADGAATFNVSTLQAASGLPAAARVSGLRNALIGADGREDDFAHWREDLTEYEEERLDDGPTKEERLLLPPELLERMRLWTPAAKAAWREAVYKGMGREKAYTKPKKPDTAPKYPGDSTSLDVLAALLGTEGRTPTRRAFFRAELDVDVGLTLEMVADFGLDAVIAGGEGLRDRAADLAKAHAIVVLTHTADMSWSAKSPLRRRGPGLGAALHAAGLRPAIASGGDGAARQLRLLAATQVGEGMDPAAALAAVTLWAAEAAGVAESVGSIEVGKRADLVVWSADPFSASARAVTVLIAGREVTPDAR